MAAPSLALTITSDAPERDGLWLGEKRVGGRRAASFAAAFLAVSACIGAVEVFRIVGTGIGALAALVARALS